MFMVRNELEQVYKLSWSQIYDGGYIIRTSIDDTKMKALYQAVISNEASINASAYPFESYMHVGAVLVDPATGAIQALYPGPGYPGYKYNGVGRVITARECAKIVCENNLAVYSREQVGSSFKPYILATAVKQGMNVKTSTLDGFDYQYIPPDSLPKDYPSTSFQAMGRTGGRSWSPTTPRPRTARSRRSWPWPNRSTPRTRTCGTSWRAATANNVAQMAQRSAWTPTRPASPVPTTCRTTTASPWARRR